MLLMPQHQNEDKLFVIMYDVPLKWAQAFFSFNGIVIHYLL